MYKKYLFTLLLFGAIVNANAQQQFYVSPNGDNNNPGSLEKPFATITKARDAIRKIKKDNGLPINGVKVFIRGGNYPFTSSLDLIKEDAGEAGKPIIYQAYQNEVPHLIGGSLVKSKDWKPLSKEAKNRVNPKVSADKLVELDLNKQSFINVKQFAPKNLFTTDWYIIDLFADNLRQPISQWPNPKENIRGVNDPGWTTTNGSKDNFTFYFAEGGKPQDKDGFNDLDADATQRSERWAKSLKDGHELWLKGLWRTPWEPITTKIDKINLKDKSISLLEQPPHGMGSKYTGIVNENPLWRVGSGKENYFAINYLDEIDQPGEWAVDFKDQKLYYYPPKPIDKLNIMISDMKLAIINIKDASYIQIKGLTIEGGLGDGITMTNSNKVLVADNIIQNVGATGITINGGFDNKIQSNDILEIAGCGIEINNVGDRYQLQPGNDTITNNHIHDVGKLAFKEAIMITNSVGLVISHNLIHDTPKGAIRTLDVNDCLFEYNEIHNIALKEGDNGVFYNYGGWSTYGNIYRYNFSHHTNRANGFYSDDGDSGDFYYNNIVYDCISAVKFGGGHDLLAENNLIIKSKAQTVDDRGKDRNYRLGTKYETNLTKFNIDKSPWKEYGEKLMAKYNYSTKLWSDILVESWHPELPNGSRVKNNIIIGSGPFVKHTGLVEISDNTSIPKLDESLFFDFKLMDLRSNNPQILQKFPTLNDVFPLIGLQKDNYRKVIPTRKETGGLSNRGDAEAVDTEDKMIDKVIPKSH